MMDLMDEEKTKQIRWVLDQGREELGNIKSKNNP